MNTKIAQYETGDTGYTAMVSDVGELFSWDSFQENTDTKGNKSTLFKMSTGGNGLVGITVSIGATSNAPIISAFANNGSAGYSSSTSAMASFKNVAYAYGDGFFVACGSNQALPASDGTNNNYTVGVARSKNMLTGDTEYCSFAVHSSNYYFFTQHTLDSSSRDSRLYTNASVGAAISLHDPKQLFVADNILLLTAIPDTVTACLSSVLFNGVPYTRLGRILIPGG